MPYHYDVLENIAYMYQSAYYRKTSVVIDVLFGINFNLYIYIFN